MMQKISGILPSSPRVTAVDLTKEKPVRAGVPTFGRPVAPSSLSERNPKNTMVESSSAYFDVYGPSGRFSKGMQEAQAAREMADAYFSSRETVGEEIIEGEPKEGLSVMA